MWQRPQSRQKTFLQDLDNGDGGFDDDDDDGGGGGGL